MKGEESWNMYWRSMVTVNKLRKEELLFVEKGITSVSMRRPKEGRKIRVVEDKGVDIKCTLT